MTMLRTMWLSAGIALAGCAAPDDAAAEKEPLGVGSCIEATFDVFGERIKVQIRRPEEIENAQRLLRGEVRAIPVGRLVCGDGKWNAPWSWHLDPWSVELRRGGTEVCDALPSYVEAHCKGFANGYYCPFGARIVAIDPICR